MQLKIYDITGIRELISRGLGRAVVRTILLGQSTGGGSTITQQLAKQLYPSDTARTSAFIRKLRLGVSKFKEWQTAVKLERSYTKEEIITMYLNKFDFLYNATGIRSAAKVYFNTTPDSLESAASSCSGRNAEELQPDIIR